MAAVWVFCLLAAVTILSKFPEVTAGPVSVQKDAVESFLKAHNREEREAVRRNLEKLRGRVDGQEHVAKDFESVTTVDEKKPNNKGPPSITELNRPLLPYLYHGDIILTVEQSERLLAAHTGANARSKRQAISNTTAHWQTTNIPYCFNKTSLSKSTQQQIRQALKLWEMNTCLTFKEDTITKPRLKYYNGTGCESFVGKVKKGEQLVSIGVGCESIGIIAHETGHALGFYHEQERADRDLYVKVLEENIVDGMTDQFDKVDVSDNDNRGVRYDYGSVMQYGEDYFARPNTHTIEAKAPYQLWQKTMGSRQEPSFNDVLEMNKLYKCNKKCSGVKNQCKRGGYPHPKDCTKCVCPHGFVGTHCTERDHGTIPGGCGGVHHVTQKAQTLNITMPPSGKHVMKYREYGACHWQLIAPRGKRIHLKIESINHNEICAVGCYYGGLEVRKDAFTQTGYKFCCNEQIDKKWLVGGHQADESLVVLSGYTHKDTEVPQSFTIKYQLDEPKQ